MDKKIAVMGSGYVGLVAGTCLADLGAQVTLFDVDEEKVAQLRRGKIPIYEPGLEDILSPAVESGNLNFTTNEAEALTGQDGIIIAVGTPKRADGSCDIQYVLSAAEMIGANIESDTVVINKSTVPVGTGELVYKQVNSALEERSDTEAKVEVVSNPEFLREGSAVGDFMEPDRVIVGSEDGSACDFTAELYSSLDCPVLKTGLRTAEMIKYASNAFLATKISFINEISNVCEMVGADVVEVAEGMGLDHRINRDFLGAGIGYGGSCFPKDTEALVEIAGQAGYQSQILNSVIGVNHAQRKRFARKIVSTLPEEEDLQVGALGVAFKPETDDMREAPSIDIIHDLQAEGIEVSAYDPIAMENARQVIRDVDWAESPEEALRGMDALILFTEWDEFLELDYKKVKEWLKRPVIFDGRNCLPMEELIEMGFDYYGVGRGIDRLDEILSYRYLFAEPKEKD